MDSDSQKHICNICEKSFSKKAYHNKHLKNVHKINSKGESLPDDKVICVLCDKQLKTKYHMQRHMNAVHFVDNSTTSIFECNHCSYKTIHNWNFKRHLKTHDLNESPAKALLKCSYCTASFRYSKHLNYHERKSHIIGNSRRASVRKNCPICSFVSTRKDRLEINSHFREIHNISLRWETYTFESLQLFHVWKNDLEKATTTCYIEREKSKHYVCHRSGSFKAKGRNIRHMKIMGTCKINAFCPSEIKLKLLQNGCVEAQYLSCHVGHKNQLKYIRLTAEEKKRIASQLLNKTPHNHILMGIRTSLRNFELQRIHLANKKDIINIEKSFNLNNEAIKHPYDPISIEAWVQQLKSDNKTSLLHYKPQGVSSEGFPNLKDDDFLLIYMTNAQNTMLKAHGNDVVCIDSTHGVNKYNFQLYTLLIMDESREGFPAAFMFTNKSDEHVVNIFFQKIKEKCGQITPNVFMSDMEETFYTAWSKIMGPSKLRIFCSWHVLKAWRGNLNKIKNKDKKEEVYKILKTLLYELDKETFHKLLDAAMEKLKDEQIKDYRKYFDEYYVKNRRYEQWAYCYRINSGINTNMSLENFNRVLKYCYLRGKRIQRLDKTLCAILNLLRDKLFDWFIKMKKGKVVSKLRSLRQRHRKSFLVSENNIITTDDHTWQVLSTTGQEFYTVKKIHACSNCQLLCIHCESCFHEYICSCMDHAIKNNMCKHIHLVARTKHNLSNKVLEETEETLIIDDNYCDETRQSIEEKIIGEVCVEDAIDDEETRKRRFTQKWNLFVDYVNQNVNSKEQMEYVEKNIKQMMSTLDAMASTSQRVIKETSCTSFPANKNVERQRRFFSTKKCSRQSPASRQILSEEDRNKIALTLLNPATDVNDII